MSGSFSWAIPFAHLGRTQFVGSGMCVRPLCWLQTPLCSIALGATRWWGSLIEIKSLLEPSFHKKKVLLIHKNITAVMKK